MQVMIHTVIIFAAKLNYIRQQKAGKDLQEVGDD